MIFHTNGMSIFMIIQWKQVELYIYSTYIIT